MCFYALFSVIFEPFQKIQMYFGASIWRPVNFGPFTPPPHSSVTVKDSSPGTMSLHVKTRDSEAF
jgi:hypothetical protein